MLLAGLSLENLEPNKLGDDAGEEGKPPISKATSEPGNGIERERRGRGRGEGREMQKT